MDKKTQKKFRFEVDQSIRIEELTDDSIIAIANKENSFSIRLPAKSKQRLYRYYKNFGKPKKFGPDVFSAAMVVAIEQSGFRVSELVIDIEYPGYELSMRKILTEHFPKMLIYFGVIGKKSPAHLVAYGVHAKKRKHNAVVIDKDMLKIIKK